NHSIMMRRSCAEYCFILKKRKQNMGVNYCNNFCLPFVNVKESGLRKTFFKWKLKTFVKRMDIEKFYVHSVVKCTHPSLQCSSIEQSAINSHVYLLIMHC